MLFKIFSRNISLRTIFVFFVFFIVVLTILSKHVIKIAIENNCFYIIKLYYTLGYDFKTPINARPFFSYSPPLFHANTSGMCNMLISYGADVNQCDDWGSPLIHAIQNHNYDIMKVLLKSKADINIPLRRRSADDSICVAAVNVNDPKALFIMLPYINSISKHKMVYYIYLLNNDLTKKHSDIIDRNEDENRMTSCRMLLSTMLPSEQEELIQLMVKNKMLSVERSKLLLEDNSNPVNHNIYL